MGFFDWFSKGTRQKIAREAQPIASQRFAQTHTRSPYHRYPEENDFFKGKPICQVERCSNPVSRHEFTLCLKCWMSKNNNAKQQEKELKRKFKRTISPSKRRSYNRLIDNTSRYLRKPIEMCTEREVVFSLIENMHIHPREASAFINSDAVKGLAGWIPPIDSPGVESEGFEWTDFQGGKWYRSLTEPGSWTRYGGTTQQNQHQNYNPTQEQQPKHQNYNPQPTHQTDSQTVIQNITYNIQDSAISGDINNDVNRRNNQNHQQ